MDSRRANPRIVLIGIQARSNSERFPNKVSHPADGKPVLDHVIEACASAALYMNKNFSQFQCNVRTVLLVPHGDPLIKRYNNRRSGLTDLMVFSELREDDVLSRYDLAGRAMRADYVVRVTADCIELPDHLISGMIKAAVFRGYDYVTNTHHRTFREGWDVEVLSSELLKWLNSSAVTAEQREHVTMLLRFRDTVPKNFRYRHFFNRVDDSDIKTSIDTMEDVIRFEAERDSIRSKKNAALMNGDAVELKEFFQRAKIFNQGLTELSRTER